MLTLLTVWLAACAALLCLFAPTASAAPAAALRLMPLGDSITAGSNIAGAYRTRLWQRATTDHRTDDFVGSQKGGLSQLGDLDHEGHPGWRIEQLDAQIAGWLATYKPQTILLHIGTNDITQNYDVAGAPARLSTLIDHITANAPTAEVFISNIVPFVNPGVETRAKPYNAAVPGIVSQWAAKGKHVHFVDMHSALTTADISSDGVHPSATGYSKMGDRWYQTLTAGPWI